MLLRKCACWTLDLWQLARSTTWFTLFWMRVFPYIHQDFLICPKCGRGLELRRQGATVARSLIPVAEQFARGAIDVNAYRRALNESGLLRQSGSLNWDLVRVRGLSRTVRVLIALVAGVIGAFALGPLALQARPPEFRGSEVQFRSVHPDWPTAIYWVAYVALLVSGVAVGWVAFRLSGLVEQRRRDRLNAAG